MTEQNFTLPKSHPSRAGSKEGSDKLDCHGARGAPRNDRVSIAEDAMSKIKKGDNL
jgi:hypothetical protein